MGIAQMCCAGYFVHPYGKWMIESRRFDIRRQIGARIFPPEAGKKYGITLEPDMSACIPSRVPHDFKALVDDHFGVLTPVGNLEALFVDLGKLETPDEEQIMRIFEKHGIVLLEPLFPAAE